MRLIALLGFLFAHSVATAQGWVDVTPSQPGPATSAGDSTFCHDPIRQVSWLFRTGYLSLPYHWNGTAWSTAAPTTSPNATAAPVQSTWNPSLGSVCILLSVNLPVVGASHEVWTWDGSQWSQLGSPPGGFGPVINAWQSGLQFDHARNELVLSFSSNQYVPRHTWKYSSGTWAMGTETTQLAPISIGGSFSMFYDPGSAKIMVTQNTGNGGDDVYHWNGVNWVQSYPNPRHSRLGNVATSLGRNIALAQTFWAGSLWPRTFAISGGAFSELYLTSWPSLRQGHLMTYDSTRDVFVLHGGYTFGPSVETWELSFGPTAAFSSIGFGCPGSAGTPNLAPQGGSLPRVNTQFTLQVSSLPWNGPVFMFVGFSNQQHGNIPLPANLAILGAPLCNLYISGDLLYGMTNVLGVSSWTLPIPNTPGFSFYNQAIVFDPGANPLGLTLSNAGHSIVGQ